MTKITRTQLDWIAMALQHHIADVKQEMDTAPVDSLVYALGERFVEGREELLKKIMDVANSNAKTISIY